MRIGITYDLKADGPRPSDLPDDYQEEFDSPFTINAVAATLRALGHEVVKLGDGRELLERLLADPPDLVFNLAEGQGIGRSREARVPAVLEMLDIPYTGSDPLTLAVTLDKSCAKRLIASVGVAVPKERLLTPHRKNERYDGPFPAIVKPAWEGSSKGIRNHCVVNRPEDLPDVIASLRRDHRQPVLVEEFIRGDELTVGILGNDPPRILGIMRVLPRKPTEQFVYSLEVKRDYLNQVRYECPAKLAAEQTRAVQEAALKAYDVLGCRDVCRVDFRLREGVPYFLEVNPLPGINPESSDLVIMANALGWNYGRLIETILQAAIVRHENDILGKRGHPSFPPPTGPG
jgi:D-alanine-D-alanine ligase